MMKAKLIGTALLPLVIIPMSVNAEIKALGDDVLGNVTGQSGITIDIEAQVSIGEIAYKDGGYITMEGLRLGGLDRSANVGTAGKIDNARLLIDVAEQDEALNWQFSDFGTIGGGKVQFNDGDLVLHFTNIGNLPPFTFSARGEEKVDFGLELDAVRLRDSGYNVGDSVFSGGAGATTLMSNLKLEGWMGPTDFVIRNAGDGYDANGVADSKIEFNSMFRIDDMELDVDIAGVSLKGMKISNTRGNFAALDYNGNYSTTVASNTFAQVNGKVYAVTQGIERTKLVASDFAAGNVSGLGIDARFIADMDIGDISFGSSGTTMGAVYMTDIDMQAQLYVSAH